MAPTSKNRPRLAVAHRADGGDTVSFDDLYERFGGRVLNLAYRICGNADTARDLAQDVWLKVYEKLATFEERADAYTWIYRITVNHVLNHLRRERRVRWFNLFDRDGGGTPEDTTDPAAALPSGAAGADRALETDERARRVWEAIQSLDPAYRTPLVLHHYEEMSYRQIADTMDLSLAAVEARIHRARKQLIRKLGPLLDQL
ncbi:MAG TPA: sigma-70 family RNA polymerase sigma factor [Candidatus Krumholzibacteria bacterium]|nr:sigma-70 family RNA polymerase sigma factor [Candidatus Krumholzibacteria bacterium]